MPGPPGPSGGNAGSGNDTGAPGGWQKLQWNFLAETGVNAPDAWQRMIDIGRPGGQGTVVAVLDTGVAYSSHGRCPRAAESSSRHTVACRRSPDFHDGDFVSKKNGKKLHYRSGYELDVYKCLEEMANVVRFDAEPASG